MGSTVDLAARVEWPISLGTGRDHASRVLMYQRLTFFPSCLSGSLLGRALVLVRRRYLRSLSIGFQQRYGYCDVTQLVSGTTVGMANLGFSSEERGLR